MFYKVWLPTFIAVGGATYLMYRRRIPQTIINWILSSASSTKLTKDVAISGSRKILYEVIFFPDEEYLCKRFVFTNGKHCGNNACTYAHKKTSFFKLCQHMLKTRKTLDVCVYTICHELLADILIELHKQRGVLVRIVTDDGAMTQSNCQICRLKSAGIAVRVDLTNTLMHHKFVVIDKKHLVNGSFNWSFNAVTRNNENVLITNVEELVSPYILEFEKLWDLFDPDKKIPVVK